MKVWMRERAAPLSASPARSISSERQRANAAITGRRTVAATCFTPSASDRKSTRLNSSHPSSSYAVYCLKKKKKIKLEEFRIKPKNALCVFRTFDDNPGLELSPEPMVDDDGGPCAAWDAHFPISASPL